MSKYEEKENNILLQKFFLIIVIQPNKQGKCYLCLFLNLLPTYLPTILFFVGREGGRERNFKYQKSLIIIFINT